MPADDGGDRAQAFVAGLVAVMVVEQLEMIDVDEQQRQRLSGCAGRGPIRSSTSGRTSGGSTDR
ncbi:hypothetical protein ACU4GH_15650 [Bradyrhizobium betae]